MMFAAPDEIPLPVRRCRTSSEPVAVASCVMGAAGGVGLEDTACCPFWGEVRENQ